MELGKIIPQKQVVAAQALARDGGAAQRQDPQQAQNSLLARLVKLAQSALDAESQEKAGHLIVNQIHTLIKTERAVLVPVANKKQRIFCISGDLTPSDDNSFSQAVHEVRTAFGKERQPRVISRETLGDEPKIPNTRKILDSMGGTSIVWLPLPLKQENRYEFGLWLERWGNKPWTEEEIRLLGHARTFFSHALVERKKEDRRKKPSIAILPLIIMTMLLFVPINGRVNAPAQVVPNKPSYIFAPFNGILEELLVQPGERVKEGDVVFRYDTRVLEKQLEEARSGLQVARAELARLEGAGYMDEEARSRLPVQKLEVERRQAEVDFLREQLALSEVRADADGVIVLDEPDELIGAPLSTGQMVLSIADPERTKLRIMVPVKDAGLIREAAEVTMRPDTDPFQSYSGTVSRIGFDVVMSEERVPSILVEVAWDEPVSIRPGQRGAAKIEGPQMPMGLLFLRKQIIWVRMLFGI